MTARVMFSPAVIAKAERYLREGRVWGGGNDVFLVQGSAAWPYRVQTDANPITRTVHWAQCTCPHGSHQGGPSLPVCAHVVAVLMVIRDALEVPLWSETLRGPSEKRDTPPGH